MYKQRTFSHFHASDLRATRTINQLNQVHVVQQGDAGGEEGIRDIGGAFTTSGNLGSVERGNEIL